MHRYTGNVAYRYIVYTIYRCIPEPGISEDGRVGWVLQEGAVLMSRGAEGGIGLMRPQAARQTAH